MGPNSTSPSSKKGERCRSQRRRSYADVGSVWRYAATSQEGAGGGKGKGSLLESSGDRGPVNTVIQISILQNCEGIHCSSFMPLSLGSSGDSPRKQIYHLMILVF